MIYRSSLGICLALVLAPAARADGRYDETTQITGGTLHQIVNVGAWLSEGLKKPSTSTVMVSGNRMARVGGKHTTVFDLDGQTVTRIDHARQEYSVITFAELLKKLQAAQEKLKGSLAQRAGAKAPSLPAKLADVPVNFDTRAEATGAAKTISGIATHELLLTSRMSYGSSEGGGSLRYLWKNDQWLADSEPPGWSEIASFKKSMAEKMQLNQLGAGFQMLLGARPGLSAGLTQVGEHAKRQRAPVMTAVRLASPPAAPAPAAASAAGSDATADALKEQAAQLDQSGKLGGLLGSAVDALQKHAPQLAQSATQALSTSSGESRGEHVLMEQTIVLSNFSAEAAPSAAFEVPAGYSRVDWKISSAAAVALQ